MSPSRPFVTLTFAQSLDGSITRRRGEPLALSGSESMKMTHRLRAEHEAILVGIGTVLADDPSLTVRLVEGENPQPIIVDSQLRCPLDARLIGRNCWIATTNQASQQQKQQLESLGAKIIVLPSTEDGRVSLTALLDWLAEQSIHSLMVEGGARMIQQFLRERLVDRVIVTIAPLFVGGLKSVGSLPENMILQDVTYEQMGADLVVSGRL